MAGRAPARQDPGETMISIAVTSVFVSDQDRAQRFYTDVLGFETRQDVPVGEHRWVTVGVPGGQGDTELLLEPGDNPIARAYTAGMHAAGLPVLVLSVTDLPAEHERMAALGVRFAQAPVEQGPVLTAILDDSVGNLLQLVQPLG
jgi:catechol 2,3-dioxygenase-like lactoylglutathione lyase family enzyme